MWTFFELLCNWYKIESCTGKKEGPKAGFLVRTLIMWSAMFPEGQSWVQKSVLYSIILHCIKHHKNLWYKPIFYVLRFSLSFFWAYYIQKPLATFSSSFNGAIEGIRREKKETKVESVSFEVPKLHWFLSTSSHSYHKLTIKGMGSQYTSWKVKAIG